jgi:uncharacterized protein (TIGR02646 family)
MIRIDKPTVAPAVLLEKGPARVREHEASIRAGEAFDFDEPLYRDPAVKSVLYAAQHGKCCYCERRRGRKELDVEHFRPKAELRQGINTSLEKPGYYWLAYEWRNLFLACKCCNEDFKKTLFPLEDPSKRWCAPHAPNEETPSFIDPAKDDPEKEITFDKAEIKGLNSRGVTTSRLLGLTEGDLAGERRREFKCLELALLTALAIRNKSASLEPDDQAELAGIIAEDTKPSAAFAGMKRAHLRSQLGANIRLPLEPVEVLAWLGGGELPTCSDTSAEA